MFISNVFIVIFEYVYTTGCILFTQSYLHKDLINYCISVQILIFNVGKVTNAC